MQLKPIFLLSILVGAAVALLYARSLAPGLRPDVELLPSKDAVGSAPVKQNADEPKPGAPAQLSPPRQQEPADANPERGDDAAARAKTQKTAARLAAGETLSREQLHAMLARTFEGKLHDRELTPSEYDRLADAILKIRASQRVLRGVPETGQNAELRAVHEAAIRSAFAEVQDVVGIPASALGNVLGEGESGSAEDAPDEDIGRAE